MQGSRKKLCVSLFVCCAHLVHANDSLDPSSGGDIEYTGVCPCITTWSDIREEGSNGFGNPDGTLNAEVNDAMYIYPSFYGLEFCVDHDMRLPPVCNATDAGQTNATDWCSETWCYVDPDDCDLPDDDIQQSYYFPHIEELFFAYMDCAEDPAPPPVSPSYVLFPPPPPPTPPPNERGVCPYDRPYGRAMSARESKGLHQEQITSEVEWDWDFENNLDGDDGMKELQTEKGREVRRQEAGIALNGREAVSAGRSLDAFNRRRSFSSSRFSSSRFSGSRYSSRWSSGSRRRDSRRRTSSSTSYRRNSYVSTYRRRSNDFTTGVVAGVATYAALDYISSRRRFHQIIYLGASGRRRCVGGAYNYYGCHGYNPSISYRCCEGGYPDYCPDDSFDTARDEDDDKSDPCFGRDETACRLPAVHISPYDAYASCFNGEPTNKGERVRMGDLRAGDLVLSADENSRAVVSTRVIVNQHVNVNHATSLLRLHHADGSIALTPDHLILVDDRYQPARAAKVSSQLRDAAGLKVPLINITTIRGGFVNPITSHGRILAADAEGIPIVAATGNEWIGDLLLTSACHYSLSFTLAYLFPYSTQAFYSSCLESFFNFAIPYLASAKAAAPVAVVIIVVVAADIALAFGLLAFALITAMSLFTLMASLFAFLFIMRAQAPPKAQEEDGASA
mmetsp:Transcript_67619/g.112425  ORF Transcript_67619/g.112425 Transcript_67619/m.112425 type:complete len:677 (+) Transcript_67619:110-2140(+)